MSDLAGSIPRDANNSPYERAMGRPILSVKKVGSAQYRDIFNLADYGDRVFIGLGIYNPDTVNSLDISIGGIGCGDADKCVRVHPNGFLAFDALSFGAGFYDEVAALRPKRLRAKLSGTSGTLATGTYTYDNSGSPVNPANGRTLTLNGVTYEFSNDASVASGSILVAIGATADLSWTAFKDAVNANDTEVVASINTGTNVVTITSNLGGTDGNAQTLTIDANLTSDGVTVSGAVLSGGLNGVTPVIHIW